MFLLWRFELLLQGQDCSYFHFHFDFWQLLAPYIFMRQFHMRIFLLQCFSIRTANIVKHQNRVIYLCFHDNWSEQTPPNTVCLKSSAILNLSKFTRILQLLTDHSSYEDRIMINFEKHTFHIKGRENFQGEHEAPARAWHRNNWKHCALFTTWQNEQRARVHSIQASSRPLLWYTSRLRSAGTTFRKCCCMEVVFKFPLKVKLILGISILTLNSSQVALREKIKELRHDS